MLNLQENINKNLFQVFILSCPAHFPVSLWKHTWVVINKKGDVSRWEVRHMRNRSNFEMGYLRTNDLPAFEGIGVFPLFSRPHWKAEILGKIEGEEGSIAQTLCELVENSIKVYKDKDRYFLLGPNSNTYVQWILNHAPEFKVNLTWRAIGKGYKR